MKKIPLLMVLLCAACEGPSSQTNSFVEEGEKEPVTTEEDAGVEPVADAGSCASVGVDCRTDEQCCEGFCTWTPYAYIPSTLGCALPQPDGTYCEADRWCQSGRCVDGSCYSEPPQCAAEGEACVLGDSTCCDGYCYAAYITGRCVPRLGDGEYCGENNECISGNCTDNMCRAAECADVEGRCYGDAQCCTGFCTYTGIDYAPGACSARLHAGAACSDARWCESQVCTEGLCQ